MVCKEEVISWFKDLESYKRIDVLYELLNMCVPFELRFLGTCVEEIGKRTYQELLTPTDTSNNLDKLKKDVIFNQGLCEESVRHRLLLSLSLLTSRNVSVAEWLYKKLLRTDYFDDDGVICEISKSEVLQSEFLLLYTMALYHPAFNFDQKQDFYTILARLLDIKENRIAKPTGYDCPPGFGYLKKKSFTEPPLIPVKAAPTLSYNETIVHQPPPGLPQIQPPPPPPPPATIPPTVDFMWNRPGFQCGAPEVAPFTPAAPISPLVSQTGSPSHSRSTSPHRTPMAVRNPPPLLPIPSMEILPQSSLPIFNPDLKLPEEENSIHEEKPMPWSVPGLITAPPPEFKQNGMRFPPPFKRPPNFIDQMQSLSLDGESSNVQQSNSSSNSSPNQTPPGTPSSTVSQHASRCDDRTKGARVNGIPFGGTAMCDTTSPPPPPAAFNCPVPYTYPQSSFPPMPPQPTSPFPPSRTPPGCYNCGAPNHLGTDCTAQNIDEITQKNTYQLDYSAVVPDTEK